MAIPQKDYTRELASHPTMGILYHRWRARYNDARKIIEHYIPRVLAQSRMLPSVYTVDVLDRVFHLLDEGNINELNILLDAYDPLYTEALRKENEARRRQAEAAQGDRKLAISLKKKERHAL